MESIKMNDGLWQYSIKLYAAPGMESLCLRLQDHHGVNVCLLLWCLWLDQSGRSFDKQLWRLGQRKVQWWHRGLVTPLRAWRRSLSKQGRWAGWRHRLQNWEIWAEQAELGRLESLALDTLGIAPLAGDVVVDRVISLSWDYTRQILGPSASEHLPALKGICSSMEQSV